MSSGHCCCTLFDEKVSFNRIHAESWCFSLEEVRVGALWYCTAACWEEIMQKGRRWARHQASTCDPVVSLFQSLFFFHALFSSGCIDACLMSCAKKGKSWQKWSFTVFAKAPGQLLPRQRWPLLLATDSMCICPVLHLVCCGAVAALSLLSALLKLTGKLASAVIRRYDSCLRFRSCRQSLFSHRPIRFPKDHSCFIFSSFELSLQGPEECL